MRKMYKLFYANSKGTLYGTHTTTKYKNARGKTLKLENAIGFTAKPIEGNLSMCRKGYHAASAGYFTTPGAKSIREYIKWRKENGNEGSYLFEVELHGVSKDPADQSSTKKVARSFTIKRRLM